MASLALFSCADHDVCVPRRSAFEQDVEHGNTDGLGDCQSKQAFFTLICPSLVHPLLLVLSSPSTRPLSFFERPFPSFAAVTFWCPVCSALTIHSFSLIHPSVPFGTHPPLSFPPAASLAPWSIGCCVRLGKDWAFSHRPLKRTHHKPSAAHREGV